MLPIYNLSFYIILPFLPIRLLWRSRKNKAYKECWAERFGYIQNQDLKNEGHIWLHAVSLGESIAATPLIKSLQKKYPNNKIVVTTMTPTGREFLKKTFGDSIIQLYVPYDFSGAVKRFLKAIRPKILVIMETELWPNILYYCNKQKIPVVLANACLSNESFMGYKKIKWFSKKMLDCLTHVLTQSENDSAKFLELGLDHKKLLVAGNIKFDINIPEDVKTKGQALRKLFGGNDRKIFVAASTHKGEEEKILAAFNKILQQMPTALLVLVPRHLERFDEVFVLCQKSGLATARFSHLNDAAIEESTQIVLGDVMGKLLFFYAASDIAFVGGSFVPIGGHNLLEPAALGIAILTGPSIENCKETVAMLLQANAAIVVNNELELALQVIKLMQDDDLRNQYGKNAAEVVQQNRGVTEKTLGVINDLLSMVL
jgi:3-deoxy-D-manno-octulosonic-acid transferase